WKGMCAVGRGFRTAAGAFARFWGDVFQAILPERGEDDEEDEEVEVEEDDVLAASDEEHGPEPVIIERTSPSAIEVIDLTPDNAKPKKKGKREVQKTEIDLAVPGPAPESDEPDATVAAEATPPPKKKRMAAGTEAPPVVAAAAEEAPTDHAGPVIF